MTTLWWCQQSRSHWKQWNPFRMGLQPILEQLTKIFVITVKELEPATSSVRDQHATSVPARHMWETGSLNCAQFMLQWFIRFPEFAEFGEFLFHLGKTPLFSIRPVLLVSSQHCRSIDTDAQCKRALTVIFLLITRSDPETGEQYSELTFSIHIRRNPIFYNMLIVKPGILLGVMTIFTFLMPPSATDRYSYGM